MMQRSGQAMIIAVLALGGAILGATTLAGVLLLYQIRSTTDSVHSAQAIFAADAGVNWALYDYFDSGGTPIPAPGTVSTNPSVDCAGAPVGSTCSKLDNDAIVETACYDNGTPANQVDCANSAAVSANAGGIGGDSHRLFVLDLTDATSTLP